MNDYYNDPQQISLPSLDCVIETVRPFRVAGAQVNKGTLPESLCFAVLNNWCHVRDRAEACLRLDEHCGVVNVVDRGCWQYGRYNTFL
jgi:hypothetical protein